MQHSAAGLGNTSMKSRFLFFLFLIIAVKAILLSSCANIIPPEGGPKDTLPPVLIKAEPGDSTLHFNSNKIILSFNEYVLLDNNWTQNLIVSPNPENMPAIQSKLQTVTVRLKDSLKPNTTYAINFGNSIKDVNEGNVYKQFTYVFSTGSSLDKGRVNGNVQIAETGEIDSTLIVVLHNNLEDSAVKKLRPLYYTTINGKGDFSFNWLPAGKYNVFVLPNDYTKKYDDSTKMFAFLNAPVTVDSTASPDVKLFAYQEYKKDESKQGSGIPAAPDKNKKKDTSIHIKYITNLQDDKQDLLEPLEITLQNKITSFDSSKIILTDTNYNPIKGYTIGIDTALEKVTLSYAWKEAKDFKLLVHKEAFTDSAGNHLPKDDTLSFTTAPEKEYGSIRLRFANLDLTKNPVLQLVQGGNIVDAIPVTGEIYRKLYKPGEYEMRILYDANKNGVWDAGNYLQKRQPETSVSIPRKLTIKANWDNEVNVNL